MERNTSPYKYERIGAYEKFLSLRKIEIERLEKLQRPNSKCSKSFYKVPKNNKINGRTLNEYYRKATQNEDSLHSIHLQDSVDYYKEIMNSFVLKRRLSGFSFAKKKSIGRMDNVDIDYKTLDLNETQKDAYYICFNEDGKKHSIFDSNKFTDWQDDVIQKTESDSTYTEGEELDEHGNVIKKSNQENNDSDESIERSGLKPKRRERKLATNYYKGFRNSVKYTSYWLSCIDKLLKFEDSDLFEINNRLMT